MVAPIKKGAIMETNNENGNNWLNEITKSLVNEYAKSQLHNYGRALTTQQAREELLAGSELNTYEIGTTLPINTYVDELKTTCHPNPITLNSAGDVVSVVYLPNEGCDLRFIGRDEQEIARINGVKSGA